MNLIKINRFGFSLIELVAVILISSILATATVVMVSSNQDAARYEETRQRLEALRAALLGDDSVDADGHKTHFGYHGDMGRLPSSLGELTTVGTQSAWAFDSTNGFGVGWRGPYVSSQLTASITVDKDAWNRAYIYNTSGTATITSYAADNASGGSVYGKDIIVSIPATSRFATVRGVLSDGNLRVNSTTVRLRYPSNGAMAEATASTDASGGFNITSIPWGIRSLAVTSSPTLGPSRVVIDSADVTIPPSTLDFGGKSSVSYVAASASVATNVVDFQVTSTYPATLTTSYLTATWSRLAYLQTVTFDPSGANLSQSVPFLSSGTRYDTSSGTGLTLAAGSTTTIRLIFSETKDGNGTPSMSDTVFHLTFEWSGVAKHDSLGFST